MLFEAFPVQNTDGGRAAQDAALQRQLDVMLQLLNDTCVCGDERMRKRKRM